MVDEERGVMIMPRIEERAFNKQMAMLNREVARMATKQKMAKYLGNYVLGLNHLMLPVPCCLFCPLPRFPPIFGLVVFLQVLQGL